MARLDAATRARLPDSSFAYIDAQGRRRLPIYDEPHVRAALSRFNQVAFEDGAARDRARRRLLTAAKRYGIVPIGFIDGQLRGPAPVVLPSGFVTLLMADIEGSTALVRRLGDRYHELITDVRSVMRRTVEDASGHIVEARADDFFACFEQPLGALNAAMAIQLELAERAWLDDLEVRMRVGIHSGYPLLREGNYLGLPVHITARICAAAHGGQVVLSAETRKALVGSVPDSLRLKRLGRYRLRGIAEEASLYQLAAAGLVGRFPPLRTEKVVRGSS